MDLQVYVLQIYFNIRECCECHISSIVRFVLYIQPATATTVSLLWSGYTYNFRKALDDAGVQGAYQDDEDTGTRRYYRCLREIDIGQEINKVKSIIKDVFNNLAMKVVVESDSVKGSQVESWIESLKELQCLHFANECP